MQISTKSIFFGIGRYLLGGLTTVLLLIYPFSSLVSRNPILSSDQEYILSISLILVLPVLYIWSLKKGFIISIVIMFVLNLGLDGGLAKSDSCIKNGTYVFKGADTHWYVYVNENSWSGQVENILQQPILYINGVVDGKKLKDNDGNFTGQITCGSIRLKMTPEASRRYYDALGEVNLMNITLIQE